MARFANHMNSAYYLKIQKMTARVKGSGSELPCVLSSSNLGDREVQSCVNDERQKQQEKGENAQERLLQHGHARKVVLQL